MINDLDFATYKEYLTLQKKHKELYIAFELQYELCRCFQCKLRVITCGLEMLSLNTFIEHLESELLPDIVIILGELQINYTVTETGETQLIVK